MADGMGCICCAHSESECTCAGVDWRSSKEVELEKEVARLRDVIVNEGLRWYEFYYDEHVRSHWLQFIEKAKKRGKLMDFKKEFAKLNKDPEYLKELIKLGQAEEKILLDQNYKLKELVEEVQGLMNECLECHVQAFNQTEIYSDLLHIHDFCEQHFNRIVWDST